MDRLVRSVTPEPGAWTTFRGERLGLGPVRPADATGAPELKPGELHAEKRRVLAGTATAPVELGEVRPVGRRPMPAADWARGVRITSGEVLGMTEPRDPRQPRRSGRPQRRGRPAGPRGAGPPRGRQGPARPPELDPARMAALELLTAVRVRNAYANLAFPAILRRHGLRDRDAALATELGYGTLRAQGLLDAVIDACTERPLHRIEPPLLDALRLGAYQLLRTRVPPHAAVDTTVELVRVDAGSRSAGFVNAVLRRIGEHGEAAWVEQLAPDPKEDAVGHAALAHAHPRWVAQAFADALGARAEEELDAALAADDARPSVHLLARPGEVTAEELALVTGGEPAPYSPYGVHLEPGSGDIGELDAVREGLAVVQDEGSQLVALALTRVPRGGHDDGRTAGSTCAPGPAASPRCWAGSSAWRAARWTPSSPPSTAPSWCAGPSTGCRSPCTSRTAARRRCPTGPSTGCWSTLRAPAWARCGGGPRRGGGAARRTWPSCRGCSASCSPRRCGTCARAAWWPTSPARRTWRRPWAWWRP